MSKESRRREFNAARNEQTKRHLDHVERMEELRRAFDAEREYSARHRDKVEEEQWEIRRTLLNNRKSQATQMQGVVYTHKSLITMKKTLRTVQETQFIMQRNMQAMFTQFTDKVL